MTACPPTAVRGFVRGPRWRRLLRLMPALLAIATPPVGASSARAQVAPVPAAGPVAGTNRLDGDASVLAVALGAGNMLYAGGSFAGVAARTGHWVRFDGSGARDPAWPEVDGSVDAVASDGAGGWFIGGRFTHVGGQPRARLAHVGANGEVEPAWGPAVTGRARV